MGYKAVCFDIDGTLYPRSVMNYRLLALGLKHPFFSLKYNKMRRVFREIQDNFDEDCLFKNKSMVAREAIIMQKKLGNGENEDIGLKKCDKKISLVNTSAGTMEAQIEKYIYRPIAKLYKRTKPYDGVVETFKRLKANGVKIGVFSDFPLLSKLEGLGLSQYVDFAASSEDVGFLKPNIHCFEYLMYNMNLKPSETLYVGDSYSKDVVGAHGAGLDAVLVNAKDFDAKGVSSEAPNEKGAGSEKYPLSCGVFSTWFDFDRWLFERLEDV